MHTLCDVDFRKNAETKIHGAFSKNLNFENTDISLFRFSFTNSCNKTDIKFRVGHRANSVFICAIPMNFSVRHVEFQSAR